MGCWHWTPLCPPPYSPLSSKGRSFCQQTHLLFFCPYSCHLFFLGRSPGPAPLLLVDSTQPQKDLYLHCSQAKVSPPTPRLIISRLQTQAWSPTHSVNSLDVEVLPQGHMTAPPTGVSLAPGTPGPPTKSADYLLPQFSSLPNTPTLISAGYFDSFH